MNTRHLFLLSVILAVLVPEALVAQPGQLATVAFVDGDARINGERVDFGDTVAVGDRVQVGPRSFLELRFGSGNAIQFQENTVATVSIQGEFREVSVETGSFAATLGGLARRASGDINFRVRTATTVGGVRGTSFFVRAVSPTETYFCLCNGEMDLMGPGGELEETISAGYHAAFRFTRDSQGRIQRTNADLEFHTTRDINNLAGGVGYTIPWDENHGRTPNNPEDDVR